MFHDTSASLSSGVPTPLSLDLSTISPLSRLPSLSNTLLITNLQDLEIFRPENLQIIKDLIHVSAPIHSWAPLKSFRRVIVSFFDEDSAIRIRQTLDGETIMGERVRVYFGQPTPTEAKDEHLPLPDAGKLFFISPPPSPPHGWEMKLEGAPNKQVCAEDLVIALAKLHHKPRLDMAFSATSDAETRRGRQRSGSSTTIYRPEDHGDSLMLPAIEVEDLTDYRNDIGLLDADVKPIVAQTARPPVELIDRP